MRKILIIIVEIVFSERNWKEQFYALLDVSITEVLGFYYKEGVMIDKDFTLRLSIMKAEEQSSICAIDTIVRIDEPEEKLYTCSNCV